MGAANPSTSGSEHSDEHSQASDHDRFTASNEPSHPPHAHWTNNTPAASPNLGVILGFGTELMPTARHGPTATGMTPVSPGSSLVARLGIATGTGTAGAKDGGAAAGATVAGRGGASGARQEHDRNRDRSRPGEHSDDIRARSSVFQQRVRDRPAFSSINRLVRTRDSNGAAANHRGDGGAFGSNRPQGNDVVLEEAEGEFYSAPHSLAAASARYPHHHRDHRSAGDGLSYLPRHPHYPAAAWGLHQQQLHHAGQQHPIYGPTHQQQPTWHYHSSGGPFPQHIQHPNQGFHLPPPPPPPALTPHQQYMQQQAPPHSASVSSSSVPGHTWPTPAPSSGSTSKDLINMQSPPPAGSVLFPSSSRLNDDASGTVSDSHQGTRRPHQHMQQSSAHPSFWPSHPYYQQHQYPQPHYGMGMPTATGWEPIPHWHHSRHQPPPDIRAPLPPAVAAADHGCDSTATSTSKVLSAPNTTQGSSEHAPQQSDSAQGRKEPRDAINGLGGAEKLAVTHDPSAQADCGHDSTEEGAHESPAKPVHRGDYNSGTDRGPWPSSASYNPDTMPNDLYAPSHHDPSAYAWHGPPFHPPPHRHGYSSFGPPPPSAAAAAGLEGPSRGLEPGDTVFDPITQSTLDQFFPDTPSRSSAAGLIHGNDASHGTDVSPSAPARGPPFGHSIRQPRIPPGPPTIGTAYTSPDHHAYHQYAGSHYPPPPPPGPHAHYTGIYHPPPPPPPFPPSFSHMPPPFPVPSSFGPHSPTDSQPPHPPFQPASFDRPDPVSPSRAQRPQIGRRATASKASGGTKGKVQKSTASDGSRSKSRKAAAAAASADSDSSESDELDEDADDYDEDEDDETSAPGRGRRSTAKHRKRAPRKQPGNHVGSTLFVRGKPVDGGQSRSYLVFTREAYAKMVKCLQLAAQGPEDVYSSVELRKEWKDVAASSTVRKRWKRLQFNLQVVPERQEFRQLAWRSSTLIIAPREDWDDILREAHHSDLPPEQHASVRQTIMSIRDRYETRRSRCGITAEAIDSFCHRCECYRRLLNSIANGSEAEELRAAGNVEGQVQAVRVEQEEETIDDGEDDDEDDEDS